jgi:CubicO group peptidase (beta-lactamase class C family)
MFNTFITVDSAHLKDIAQGYTEEGAPNPIWQDHVLTGAGSFLSNATDMTAFIRANLAANNSPVATSLLKTHGINTQSDKRLGWIAPSDLDSFMGNTDIIWHNGLAGGYASYIAIDKHTQSGIIILSNKAVDITTFGMEMIRMVNTQSRKE